MAEDETGPRTPGVTERIRQRMGELTPSERRVARAMLAGAPTVGLESSASLAERVGVSGPTVSRFAQRLGFENYAAFQQSLREDIAARVMSPVDVYRQHVERTTDNALGAAGMTLGEAVSATLAGLSTQDFELAAASLSDSRRQAVMVGGWFSYLLAGYFASMLREFRPRVRQVLPIASERAAALADLEKKDVVVVMDFRRYEQDTLEFAQAAHDAGARIVLFTDPWLSPVADIADAVLPAQVMGPSPFESLTPTLAVVETLLTAVAERLGDAANKRFEHFGGIVDRWVRPWPLGQETRGKPLTDGE
jgi:DNA-binding MurR/RpiR family transcriptional regulator